MGCAMVREASEASAEREGGLTEPTFRGVLLTGLPGFLREGFLPVGAFYGGLRLSGLVAGIAASTAVSVLIYLYERRAGRDGLLVRVSLAFVALQTAVGLAANSATVYLAQPVLANAAWGLAFFGLESFLLTVFLTGAPMMFLLIAWSIRHSIRGLADADVDPPDLTPSGRGATLDGEHTFVTLPDPGDANADRPTAGDLEVPHGLRRPARLPAHGA